MLPKDPYILLSYVNTKLRDDYATLEDLCEGLDVAPEDVTEPLSRLGCVYDPARNAFVTRG